MNYLDKTGLTYFWGKIKALFDKANANISSLQSNKADKTEVNALGTRVSTAENNINVLDARMDTFASLPSGSTSGNAELIDIRVGHDGTTYASAGDAVRGQTEPVHGITVFSLLDVDCERGGYYSTGKLDDTDSTKNARIRTATGIRVKKGDYFVNDAGSGYGVIFVPDDMSSLSDSGWLLQANTKWVAPSDGYARITLRKSTSDWITATEENEYRSKLHVYKKLYDQVGTTENRIENLEKTVLANQSGFTYVDPSTLIWGGLENGERHIHYAWRIITKDIQQYDRDIVVKADDGYKFGVATFVGNNYSSWSGWVTSYTIKSGTRFRIQFAKDNDSSATPAICNAEEIMAQHFVYSTEIGSKLLDESPKMHAYVGEKIPSTAYGFDSELFVNMASETGITSQDIEIFGDYLFVAFTRDNGDAGLIRVYSLKDKSLVTSLSVDVQHGTRMQFSNEYYDKNDVFPLLYAGGWTTNLINAIRITKTNNTWSTSIARELYIPTSKGYYLAPSVDAKHNVLYCYGNKASNYHDHNGMVLLKYDLSELTNNGNNTYTPKLLNEIETPDLGVQQGGKYYGGNLYVGFSDEGGAPHNSRLVAIDATTGDVKTDIDMTGVTTSENEGVCYQITDGKINWYYSDYWNIYKLYF